MTTKPPVFNPPPVQKNHQKNQRKKSAGAVPNKERSFFRRRTAIDPHTRTLNFAPRTAQSVFSVLFFSLFLVMCVVVLFTFGRVATLTRLALSKQVNSEELVTMMTDRLTETEQLKYEGGRLAERLVTFSTDENGKKEWEEHLRPYLAQGLVLSELGFSTTSVARVVQDIQFIKLEILDEKEALYRVFYDVRFEEGKDLRQVQLLLPVSYKNGQLYLMDYPTFTHLEPARDPKQAAKYQADRFSPVGQEVKDEEKENVLAFTQRFFDLYVSNDEKLALVTTGQGLDQARLIGVEPKQLLKLANGNYYVQGTYQFAFQADNPLKSNFTLEIQPTKESYFVIKMNGE